MSRWQSAEDKEEQEELEGEWELDPNDPSHPDYDLSVAAGYAEWEPGGKPWFLRRGAVLAVTLLGIAGLVIIPLVVRLT